jgi:RNA polymerase sigma factor (sigma-70 family)
LDNQDLAGYSVNQLIRRYQKDTENDVAFALLSRYKGSEATLQGEILWGLLAPHQRDLARIVAGMKEDPQEELQKLFVKLHQLFLREKFPHSTWKFWLTRIVKNDLLNQKKRKNPLVAIPLEALPEPEEESQPEAFNTDHLQDAIARLTDTQRQVVELRYGRPEGKLMTYKEIAALMNCSVGQVHGYLDRAKENLRNHLNELA